MWRSSRPLRPAWECRCRAPPGPRPAMMATRANEPVSQAPHKPLRTVLAPVLLEHGRGPLRPTGTGPLELTPDHLRTAQTCGCVFLETHATLLPAAWCMDRPVGAEKLSGVGGRPP